jgi:hypothetical protein
MSQKGRVYIERDTSLFDDVKIDLKYTENFYELNICTSNDAYFEEFLELIRTELTSRHKYNELKRNDNKYVWYQK